jgi:hypothetical protein
MASGQYTKALELAVASGVLWTSGTVRWPENGASIPLEVRAPGST